MQELDDIFSPYKKGWVYRVKNHSSGRLRNKRSALAGLSSKQKAWGIVNRVPECVVKFGAANIKSMPHLIKAADYIARNGSICLEDQDGQTYQDKMSYRSLLEDWQEKQLIPEETDRYSHGRRFILSMPRNTDEAKFKEACREWASHSFKGYDYLLAFHFPGSDKKTEQPHCHILLRTIGPDGVRIDLSNADRMAMREHFAFCLNKYGIRANSTERRVRGKVEKSPTQKDYNAVKRFHSDSERNRAYAIARKKALLPKNLQTRIDEVSMAAQQNRSIRDHSAVRQAKQYRGQFNSKLAGAIRDLSQNGSPSDAALATKLRAFQSALPKVQSQQQKALNQIRAQKEIARLEAMKKAQSARGKKR